MNYKKFLGAASAALMIVIILTLMLAPGAQAANKCKWVYSFAAGTDGSEPQGLIFDQVGNLYGTTRFGGNSIVCGLGRTVGCGVVFKLTPKADGSWTESVLYRFAGGTDGGNPQAGLTFDAAGNLYGTTSAHAGNVFKLTPNADGSWTESVLYTFTYGSDGYGPSGGLIFGQDGNLYGTTVGGGNSKCNGGGCGVVFKLTQNPNGSWKEKVLHTFCSLINCDDGLGPSAGLIFDANGNLYGTASGGGGGAGCPNVYTGGGCGVVFKLTPNPNGSWKEKVLYRFTGGTDGGAPSAGVIFDAAGNLYGTTTAGGTETSCAWYNSGCGVIFKLKQNPNGSWKEKVLHTFCSLTYCDDGAEPSAGLIFDANGNLYGMASHFGQSLGVVFKLTANANGSWTEKKLFLFGRRDFPTPYASLIFDAAGNLYGMTNSSYRGRFGSVFEIAP